MYICTTKECQRTLRLEGFPCVLLLGADGALPFDLCSLMLGSKVLFSTSLIGQKSPTIARSAHCIYDLGLHRPLVHEALVVEDENCERKRRKSRLPAAGEPSSVLLLFLFANFSNLFITIVPAVFLHAESWLYCFSCKHILVARNTFLNTPTPTPTPFICNMDKKNTVLHPNPTLLPLSNTGMKSLLVSQRKDCFRHYILARSVCPSSLPTRAVAGFDWLAAHCAITEAVPRLGVMFLVQVNNP